MSSPCDSKRLYDTEFEATIAAAKVSYKWEAEMIPYRCGHHWHLANKDPNLRSRRREHHKMYCEDCDVYMKRGRWAKHATKRRHLKLAQKRRETSEEVSLLEQPDNSNTSNLESQ